MEPKEGSGKKKHSKTHPSKTHHTKHKKEPKPHKEKENGENGKHTATTTTTLSPRSEGPSVEPSQEGSLEDITAQVTPEEASKLHQELVESTRGLADFERIKLLGKGCIGHVYLVKLKGTEQLYAMKVLRKADMVKLNKVKRVLTEREVLATADHPFVITLYYSFQSQTQICFIMQYCAGGEFYRFIQRQPERCLKESQARFYATEVLLALEYLHEKGFIYRDLKPENILMHASGHVILTDFDLSKQATKPVEKKEVKTQFSGAKGFVSEPELVTNSFVGTEEYLAPEVLDGTGHNATVDWWTFGILLFEMLWGTTPFRGNSRDETFGNIKRRKVTFPEHKRGGVSKECKNLLSALLLPDPKKRLGAIGGAADIKDAPFFKGIHWEKVEKMKPPIVPKLKDKQDTRYFRDMVDDWEWDTTVINPSDLEEDNPWKDFGNVDYQERDDADRLDEKKEKKKKHGLGFLG